MRKRRKLSIILAIAMIITLLPTIGISTSAEGLSDAEIVADDLAEIDLGDLSNVDQDLALPEKGVLGSNLTWDSDGSPFLWNDGTVLPPFGLVKCDVTLTATATYGEASETREFSVTIANRYPYKTIVSAPDLDITSQVGDVPALPRYIEVTYEDQKTGMRPVRWAIDSAAFENDAKEKEVGDKYEIEGVIVGDSSFVNPDTGIREQFPVVANVTVSASGNTIPNKTPVAKPIPLNKVTLDGDNMLTRNRDMTVAFLKSEGEGWIPAADSILYNFRNTFGVEQPEGAAPMNPIPYGNSDQVGTSRDTFENWEHPRWKLRGAGTGHLFSALATAYASSGDEEIKDKLEYVLSELREMQLMSGYDPDLEEYVSEAKDFTNPDCNRTDTPRTDYQDNWSTDIKTWGKGFLSAYPPDQFRLLEQLDTYSWPTENPGIWAPYYTLHKLLAGFLDAYEYCGIETGLEIAEDLGAWVYNRLSNCTDSVTRTSMWNLSIAGEYGGMNEAMARLYDITGNEEYLECAKMFDNTNFFNALVTNTDYTSGVRGRHANQHIPQIVGAVKEFAMTGEEKYYKIAENFWNIVDTRYTYATGGVGGNGEGFGSTPYGLASSAGNGCETCAVYNMLKLSKDLYAYDPDNAKYMDYYERAMLNQIAGSLNPDADESSVTTADATYQTGITNPLMVTYMYPIGPGRTKGKTASYEWQCCNGTGIENHVKYQENVYFTTDDTLYTGLYVPSTATWVEKGITIKQECEYPAEYSKLTITGNGEFDFKLRVPYWATAGYELKVNGETVAENPELSTYISAGSVWKTGDVIEVFMPFEKRVEITPDKRNGNDNFVGAVMYGPIVMSLPASGTDWRTITLDSYLADDTLITAADKDDNNLYTMTVNDEQFVPINSIWQNSETGALQPYHTYLFMDIMGEINPLTKQDLFDKIQEAHDYPLDAYPYPEEEIEEFLDLIADAIAVYNDNNADIDQISEMIAALGAAIDQLESVYINIVVSAGTGGTVTGGGKFIEGDTVTLIATPNESYIFDGWYEDGKKISGIAAKYEFLAIVSRTLEARFVTPQKSSGGGSGTIPGGGSASTSTSTTTTTDSTGSDSTNLNDQPSWFQDVNVGDWFYNNVSYVYQNNLMNGTSTSPMLFNPNGTLTRGMIVTILYRQAGSPSVSGLENPFSDVPGGQWYTDAVVWAADNNLVEGYGGGLYGPETDVTREQLAAIFFRYAQFIGKVPEGALDGVLAFADAALIADYAKDAALFCSNTGIITGKPGNIFDPQGNATRAEAAAMLNRFIESFAPEDLQSDDATSPEDIAEQSDENTEQSGDDTEQSDADTEQSDADTENTED